MNTYQKDVDRKMMTTHKDNHIKMAIQLWHYIHNCTEIATHNSSLYEFIDNCTLNHTIYDSNKPDTFLYDVPYEIIVLLSIFYGTISVVAVVGNFLVIWIVKTSHRMHNTTNCFIANLALADIVIGLFAIPFQFQAALLQRWNLPYFMCPFCPFVQVLSVTVSIFTLTAIAMDRHQAILNPLRTRGSTYRAKVCITCIWVVAFFIALPMALALRVELVEYVDPSGGTHVKPFCYNRQLPKNVMLIYRTVILLVQYVVPLCIISCVYARMALRLWGSHAPGNAQPTRDVTLSKNKKKVIKMLVIVVALFAFCWLPLQTYMVLQDIFPEINNYRYINIIFFCCDWLAMSNSCYNPFIYGIYNEKFKREFQQRFPFRNRKWCSSTVESVVETDKTLVAGRPSLRSTTTTVDWRANTPTNRNSMYNRNLNCSYHVVPRSNRKKRKNDEKTDVYVMHSKLSPACASESEFDELCL